jgi:hypothetical protein
MLPTRRDVGESRFETTGKHEYTLVVIGSGCWVGTVDGESTMLALGAGVGFFVLIPNE